MSDFRLVKVGLTLVRHGETDWNANHVMQGQLDVPLNSTGEKEAEFLAKYIAGQTSEPQGNYDQRYHLPIPSLVMASPLLRAKRTSEIVRDANPEWKSHYITSYGHLGEKHDGEQQKEEEEVEDSYNKRFPEILQGTQTKPPFYQLVDELKERRLGMYEGCYYRTVVTTMEGFIPGCETLSRLPEPRGVHFFNLLAGYQRECRDKSANGIQKEDQQPKWPHLPLAPLTIERFGEGCGEGKWRRKAEGEESVWREEMLAESGQDMWRRGESVLRRAASHLAQLYVLQVKEKEKDKEKKQQENGKSQKEQENIHHHLHAMLFSHGLLIKTILSFLVTVGSTESLCHPEASPFYQEASKRKQEFSVDMRNTGVSHFKLELVIPESLFSASSSESSSSPVPNSLPFFQNPYLLSLNDGRHLPTPLSSAPPPLPY